jgi:hypothetical protein
MLAIVEEIRGVSSSDEARSPLKFEEEVKVGFEKVDDAEASDLWLSGILFNHDVNCVAPPCEDETMVKDEREKFCETG